MFQLRWTALRHLTDRSVLTVSQVPYWPDTTLTIQIILSKGKSHSFVILFNRVFFFLIRLLIKSWHFNFFLFLCIYPGKKKKMLKLYSFDELQFSSNSWKNFWPPPKQWSTSTNRFVSWMERITLTPFSMLCFGTVLHWSHQKFCLRNFQR